MNSVEVPRAEVPREERQWAAIAHLSAMLILVVPVLGGFLGPLVVWILKREDMPFVREQAREALNFQLTVLGALAVSALLLFVLIGFVLLPVVVLANLVFIVIATLRAAEGENYRYPFNLRLID